MKKTLKRNAIILISVLWIVIILSFLAFSLWRSGSMQLDLMQQAQGRVRAQAAARSAFVYVCNLLKQSQPGDVNLYTCGLNLSISKKPEDYFKHMKVGDGLWADVVFKSKDYDKSGQTQSYYGIQDEGRRLNINALNQNNYTLFAQLMTNLGVSSSLASTIAINVLIWKNGSDAALKNGTPGVMNLDTSFSSQDKMKNKPFDTPEEVLVVTGMTLEIFKKIRPFITVYPKIASGSLQPNVLTMSDFLIGVFGDDQTRLGNALDTNALKLRRDGPDGVSFTDDDGTGGSGNDLSFQQPMLSISGVTTSQYFRIRVKGEDEITSVSVVIEAVVHKDENGSVVTDYWRRL